MGLDNDSVMGLGYLVIGGIFTIVTIFILQWWLIILTCLVWLIVGSYVNDLGYRYGVKQSVLSATEGTKKTKRKKK